MHLLSDAWWLFGRRSAAALLATAGATVVTLSACKKQDATSGPMGTVVCASKAIEEGCEIPASALQIKLVPVSMTPKNVIKKVDAAAGRIAESDINEGAILTDGSLATQGAIVSDRRPAAVCVAVSPDGQTIASACNSKTIKVREAATGKELRTIVCLQAIHDLAFSPDGKTLAAVVGFPGVTITLFDPATGKQSRTFPAGTAFDSIGFSPDGTTLVGGFTVWDAATGKTLNSFKDTGSLAITPDGKQLLSGGKAITLWSQGGKAVRLWTQYGIKSKVLSSIPSFIRPGAFSPDHTMFASENTDAQRPAGQNEGGQSSQDKISPDKSPKGESQTDSDQIEPTATLTQTKKEAKSEEHALNDTDKGAIVVWSATTGKTIRRLGGAHATFDAFRPNDAVIAGSDDIDETITLWDARTGKKLLQVPGKSAAFSPDGKTLVSAGWEDIQLFELPSGKQIWSLKN